jgi:ATP-dependent Lhr-like helicase
LSGMASGRIRCIAVDTPVPSQFSHEILNANPYAYLDDAPLEERRARAVQMRRMLPDSVLEEVGGLDPGAIAQVREEAWPDVRDADELHDVLHTLVALPESGSTLETSEWSFYFERLVSEGRAARATVGQRNYWVAAERAKTFSTMFPEARFELAVADVEVKAATRDDALLTLVTGWMSHIGPTTATELGGTLGISAAEITGALLRMEASGTVLRGNFGGTASRAEAPALHDPEIEWCERRLLARIHRLTVATLRKQIEPVTAAQFMQWLLNWQHVAPGTQVLGERGTLEVLRQLQGFEIPANAWERQVLARRIVDYDPKWVDQLCLTGAVGWGRLSPHPATLDYPNPDRGTEGGASTAPRPRRVIPTSVAPITFFIREDADWMTPRHPGADHSENNGLSHGAQKVLDFLRQRGASFFVDIVRGTEKLKAEIETALWELVAAGLVTADGFDNLRSLIDPKRRAGQGSGRSSRPRHNAGRWAILHADDVVERSRAVEAACWMLLRRYGIVIRDVLAREANLPPWRELLMAFRRLEDRGEIRGGRFVDGFLGEQFALPVAVESVRALRKLEASQGTITLSAADPLNLVGILVPGDRVPAISGNSVTYRDGAAITLASLMPAEPGSEAVAS